MALLDIQRRFRELGRIRLGDKDAKKGFPRKLTEFRLTSPSKDLIVAVAEAYGGDVKQWEGAPTEGDQWEVYTGTDRLDVLVPPGEPLSQSWELWSGGGCQRRCNGHAQTTGEACACPADLEERAALAQKGQACKATTRLSIILPRIPDIGVWRVETHGLNAAVELPGTVEILRQALEGGTMVPAQLRLEQRTSKKDGETRHFVVPVLELPTVTTAQLMSGEAPGLPLRSAELEADTTPALPAGREPFENTDKAPVPLADDEARNGLSARIDKLPEDLRKETAAQWKRAEISSLKAVERFTVEDARVADALVKTVEADHKRRLAKVNAALKKAGFTTDKERHETVEAATDGACTSTAALTGDQVDLVLAYLDTSKPSTGPEQPPLPGEEG